jgi:hypothetical protein
MDHAQIYDKMRLCLQREGKVVGAVKIGIFSYVSWAIGLCKQGRRAELKRCTSKGSIEATVRTLLKKAKKEKLLDSVCSGVAKHLASLPGVRLVELGKEIESILGAGK